MSAQDPAAVSLDRVISDRVHLEPVEAYAVLQFVWERLRASRDADGRMMPLPALDGLAISATGVIDARRPPGPVSLTMRPPHELARELGHLLRLLLSSGRPELRHLPAACLDAVHRVTMRTPTPGGLRPIAAPHALFTALEAFRPRDTYAALATLFARWVTTAHRGAATRVDTIDEVGVADAADVELRLHFDSSAPVQTVGAWPGRTRRPEQTTSSHRLSLVVAMEAAGGDMRPGCALPEQ
jgi:hypothetical protein